MSELDDFLTKTLARQIEAEEAIHNGDVEPRLALWSTRDPVTVLGAIRSASGWDEVSQAFRWLASHCSDCTSYRFRACHRGCQWRPGLHGRLRTHLGVLGRRSAEPYTLRVTHVYRRENGEWKIVHRHADRVPVDQSPAASASTT